MNDNWVIASEVLRRVAEAFHEGHPQDNLLELVHYGSLFARAGKATFVRGGKIASKRDWQIPQQVWSPFRDSLRIQGQGNFLDVDFASNSAVARDLPCEEIGLDQKSTILPRSADVYLSEIRFSERDLAGLGLAEIEPGAPLPQPKSRSGPAPDIQRYTEFGAGLATVAYLQGLEGFRSRTALYKAVADYLAEKGLDAMDEKNLRPMLDLARSWASDD